ncbi:unnamed protein product, partial [Porites evermanni]
KKSFLQVDKQSGFNLLQAAVLEGKYDIVLKANGLLENFLEEMEHRKTGNNAEGFPGKTAVDILSFVLGTKSSHYSIERFYKNLAENNSRLNELQWGTCNDDVEQAVEFELSDGANVNAQRKDDKVTPLILAIEWNNYMAACLPLRHGADVDVQGGDGFTPLHFAVSKGHENLCRLLLEHNANVNIRDKDGDIPLLLCVREGNENLCRLLLEHNANVNFRDKDGNTPLHLCVRERNENLCGLLLEHNAKVNFGNKHGDTPLHWCVREGNENLCRLLLEHNTNANFRDKDGDTPLHLCVREGNENLCRLLLEHNTNANFRDKDGDTPLHLCVREGNENLSRLLLEHNAMQRHPKFELSSAQKAIEKKYTTGVASVQGAVKLKSNLQREKTLGRNPSYTHTTLETEELWETPKGTKELENRKLNK